MTSAAELLYQRRSRAVRDAELPPIQGSSRRLRPGSTALHHDFHRSHRHERYEPSLHNQHYNCHVSPRFKNLLHQVPAVGGQMQLSEQSTHIPTHGNEMNVEILGSRNGDQNRHLSIFSEQAIKNNSLRASAMRAKDRLYERFKQSSLVRNRHNSSDSIIVGEDFHLNDLVHWETEVGRDFLTLSNGQSEEVLQMEFSPASSSKCQGLNKIAICNLPKEVFVPRSITGSNRSSVVNPELEWEVCPICLEHFLFGEQLIRLACYHRFHPACLTPWLKMRGECPYCRAKA